MGTSLFDRLKMPRRLHSLALDASRETVYTHRLYLKWKVNIEWKLFFEEKKKDCLISVQDTILGGTRWKNKRL